MNRLSTGLMLAALSGAPDVANAADTFDLRNARACIRDSMTQQGALGDFECKDGSVLTKVETVDINGTEGAVDLDLTKNENFRKWLSAETMPGEDCDLLTLVPPGIGEVIASMGVTEIALQKMQEEHPGSNVCMVSMAPAGRWTPEYATYNKAISRITYKEMQQEYLAMLDWALQNRPEWFAGEIVVLAHSLGAVYGKGITEALLAKEKTVSGFVNVSGVPSGALPAVNIPFLWNVRRELPGTLVKAVTGTNVTTLDDEAYEKLMGEPTPDTWGSRQIGPREFATWGLGLAHFRGFAKDLEARGIPMVSMVASEDALVPGPMTERVLPGVDEPIYSVSGTHAFQMDLNESAQRTWGHAYDLILK